MRRDTEDALRRLEAALLEEEETVSPEETDEDLLNEDLLDALLEDTAPADQAQPYQNFSNGYTPGDGPEDPPRTTRKTDNFGFLIVACLLLVGVLCAVAFVLLRRGGYL